jgi:tripartite-type tricarboxylate transporter receptor subunit TctC
MRFNAMESHQHQGDNNMQFSRLVGIAAFTVQAVAAAPAFAADYPTRSVSIVVPYAPGGPTDATARFVAQSLQKQSGGTFIIENTPGAGTTIGTAKVAKAAPDGYTLLWGGLSSHAMAPHLYQRLTFDPHTSFEPISMVASSPYVLVVNVNSPIRTAAELIGKAKAAPGKLNYASPGEGSSPHLTTELFLSESKIEAQHIPYKGGSPAMAALLSGEVDFVIDTLTVPMPMIKSGRIRPLAVSTAKRLPEMPDVPTMQEIGLTGFEAATWFAMFAPKGTSQDVVNALNKMVNVALNDPAIVSKMSQAGLNATPSTPAQLSQTVKSENAKWGKIIKAKNIRLE